MKISHSIEHLVERGIKLRFSESILPDTNFPKWCALILWFVESNPLHSFKVQNFCFDIKIRAGSKYTVSDPKKPLFRWFVECIFIYLQFLYWWMFLWPSIGEGENSWTRFRDYTNLSTSKFKTLLSLLFIRQRVKIIKSSALWN